ncbi:MAG: hypothetical protein ACREA0_28785, partial [bacterium]
MYLESLRRSLSGPFLTYSFMHWPDTWLADIEQESLTEDPRVSVRLLPAETAGEDRIQVAMELTVSAPVKAFSLVLENEESLLRVPWNWVQQAGLEFTWGPRSWADLLYVLRGDHDRGDVTVQVPPVGYLLSGGRYIVTYGIWFDRFPELAPGVYRIVTDGRLPKGTPAGRYPLRVLGASQVLLADGTVVAPAIAGDSEIVVTEDIEQGWDEGLPPLRFDVDNRRVLGKVEFRFADASGRSVPEGEPVVRAQPGETVRFRVQARTETPLNALSFHFRWPRGLLCTFESTPLLEQGGEPVAEPPSTFSTCSHFSGSFQTHFYLGGNWSPAGFPPQDFTRFYDRALE